MFKKCCLFLALIFVYSSLAFSSETTGRGPYLGVQAGVARMDYETKFVLKNPTNGEVLNDRFLGRVYLGYAFDEYLGLELGYLHYDDPVFKENSLGLERDFTQNGVDLSLLGSLKFKHNLGGYIKGGLILVNQGSLTEDQNFIGRDSVSILTILTGFGVTYDFTAHWASDLTFTHTFPHESLPRADIYTLGLKYKF